MRTIRLRVSGTEPRRLDVHFAGSSGAEGETFARLARQHGMGVTSAPARTGGAPGLGSGGATYATYVLAIAGNAAFWTALATVIKAYLRRYDNTSVEVQLKDGTTMSAKGYSRAEVDQLFDRVAARHAELDGTE